MEGNAAVFYQRKCEERLEEPDQGTSAIMVCSGNAGGKFTADVLEGPRKVTVLAYQFEATAELCLSDRMRVNHLEREFVKQR